MAERARVAVLISGRGSNMAALLYASKASDCPFEVVVVVTDKPGAPGLRIAAAEGVATVALNAKALGSGLWNELQATLERFQVDHVALAGFMRIIPAGMVERWAGRMINIHPSLLPKYKGLHTHQSAIDNGDTVTGATVHLVTADVDSGETLGQVEVAIVPGEPAAELGERVLIAEHQLYPRALAAFVSRPLDACWIEGRVDALAGKLPEVFRKSSHGSPGWGVGNEKTGKLFAILADQHHGSDAIGLLVKSSGPDEMTGLIESRPEAYYWPKYYGASGWLGLILNRRDVDWDQVADWLERSWRQAAPPRLTRLMAVADQF